MTKKPRKRPGRARPDSNGKSGRPKSNPNLQLKVIFEEKRMGVEVSVPPSMRVFVESVVSKFAAGGIMFNASLYKFYFDEHGAMFPLTTAKLRSLKEKDCTAQLPAVIMKRNPTAFRDRRHENSQRAQKVWLANLKKFQSEPLTLIDSFRAKDYMKDFSAMVEWISNSQPAHAVALMACLSNDNFITSPADNFKRKVFQSIRMEDAVNLFRLFFEDTAANGWDEIKFHLVLSFSECLCQFNRDAVMTIPLKKMKKTLQEEPYLKSTKEDGKIERRMKKLSTILHRQQKTLYDISDDEEEKQQGDLSSPFDDQYEDEMDEKYAVDEVSLFLTEEDFLAKDDILSITPKNRPKGPFQCGQEFLYTHFHLLRNDAFMGMVEGLKELQNGLQNLYQRTRDIYLYDNVRFEDLDYTRQGVGYKLSFQSGGQRKGQGPAYSINWEVSKRLLPGTLLCLSEDVFREDFHYAVVHSRRPEDLRRNPPQLSVRFLDGTKPELFVKNKRYLMVESRVFYEAYKHILSRLQALQPSDIPFEKHIVRCSTFVEPPAYIATNPTLNLRCAYKNNERVNVLDAWPDSAATPTQLDPSQELALKNMLTHSLSVVQGPPGTGKTYVGALAVQILCKSFGPQGARERQRGRIVDALERLRAECEENVFPFLVICFSNHALDQFLEIILQFENNILRIGGRSKSEKMADYNLFTKMKNSEPSRLLKRQLYERHRIREEIEKMMKKGFYFFQKTPLNERLLNEVVPKEQLDSLRYNAPECLQHISNLKRLVSIWIDPEGFQPPQFQQPEIPVERNIYDVLGEESVAGDFAEEAAAVVSSDAHMAQFVDAENGKGEPQYNAEFNSLVEQFNDLKSKFEEESETEEVANVVNNQNSNLPPSSERNNFNTVALNQDAVQQHSHENQMKDPDLEEQAADYEARKIDIQEIINERVLVGEDEDFNEGEEPRFAPEGMKELSDNEEEDSSVVNMELLYSVPCGRVHYKHAHHIPLDANVWDLDVSTRKRLYDIWVEDARNNFLRNLQEKISEYDDISTQIEELEWTTKVSLIKSAKIVGMTTTGAAKFTKIIQAVKPKVVIVEEAAEVLEAHIITALCKDTQHLILIGDHRQLRPSVSVYDLVRSHYLDVSLFERLINNKIPYVTLSLQHRMRPDISRLIKPIYPSLKDHDSVQNYPHVRGVENNVLFFTHTHKEEKNQGLQSWMNKFEAQLIARFAKYLSQQGCYTFDDITILTMYTGQLFEIRKHLRKLFPSPPPTERNAYARAPKPSSNVLNKPQAPRLCTVDNFQGEESKVVLISLVRNNNEGLRGLGFTKVINRINVALSRAQHGLYLFGNAELLMHEKHFWFKVLTDLVKGENVKECIPLRCVNHPEKVTFAKKAQDFDHVPEGGCNQPCGQRMNCGHVCPLPCHPFPHEEVLCNKSCNQEYADCGHRCDAKCHFPEPCLPCRVLVPKVMPQCGHTQMLRCSADPAKEKCAKPCDKLMDCGHKCPRKCYQDCLKASECSASVEVNLPCGHVQQIRCSQQHQLETIKCQTPCSAVLGCGHPCRGTCGSCKQSTDHISCGHMVERLLVCGHIVSQQCSIKTAPVCHKRCTRVCVHSKCGQSCGSLCPPCQEKCAWRCPHHRCTKLCWEPCDRPPCNRRCKKLLSCGHHCLGLCGEQCLAICAMCTPQQSVFDECMMEVSLLEALKDDPAACFIALDCDHVFDYRGLDRWLKIDPQTGEYIDSGTQEIIAPTCPKCRTPIAAVLRYGATVKATQSKTDRAKYKLLSDPLIEDCQKAMNHISDSQSAGKTNDEYFNRALALVDKLHKLEVNYLPSFLLGKSSWLNMQIQLLNATNSNLAKWLEGAEKLFKLNGSRPEVREKVFRKYGHRCQDSLLNPVLLGDVLVAAAYACSRLQCFSDGQRFVRFLEELSPQHAELPRLRKALDEKVALKQVIEVMVKTTGLGHFYQCPNGHLYVIGECGGAMEFGRCPDCGAAIGGNNHAVVQGNTHSNVDGSQGPSWPQGHLV
eukprot:GCRY01005027.1.p1 GENE.GCRY01005027.1~~GCRY01005027.1.p1  ORF type:complete len:2003 (+),score=401.39 GCRY01005027.1:144-6152(+)